MYYVEVSDTYLIGPNRTIVDDSTFLVDTDTHPSLPQPVPTQQPPSSLWVQTPFETWCYLEAELGYTGEFGVGRRGRVLDETDDGTSQLETHLEGEEEELRVWL